MLGAFLPVLPVMGGAIEKGWLALAQEFVSRNHDVTIISRALPQFARHEIVDGIRHLRLRGFDTPRSLLWLKILDSALLATGQASSASGGHFGDKYLLDTAAHPRPIARKDLRSCRALSKRSDASVWKSGAVADAVERRSRRHQRRNAVVSAESHRHSIFTHANDFGGCAAANLSIGNS